MWVWFCDVFDFNVDYVCVILFIIALYVCHSLICMVCYCLCLWMWVEFVTLFGISFRVAGYLMLISWFVYLWLYCLRDEQWFDDCQVMLNGYVGNVLL